MNRSAFGKVCRAEKIKETPHVAGAHARTMMVNEVTDEDRSLKLKEQRKDSKIYTLVLFVSLFYIPLFCSSGYLIHNDCDLCLNSFFFYFFIHISLSLHINKSSASFLWN